ncbi:MAG: hypothetical protein M3268_08880 [Acidobacteriota bacterium]|nr:hypothetical protein [Acidobacteriota bacterium]
MSTTFERPPSNAEAITLHDDGGLDLSATTSDASDEPICGAITLAQLPLGARLILRCRKDWRAASVSSIGDDCVRLNVASPTGHTYRVRRPHDSPLTFDGAIPVLAERDSTNWRVALARYDVRW